MRAKPRVEIVGYIGVVRMLASSRVFHTRECVGPKVGFWHAHIIPAIAPRTDDYEDDIPVNINVMGHDDLGSSFCFDLHSR